MHESTPVPIMQRPVPISSNRDYLLLKAYQAGITDSMELAVFMGQMEVESGGFENMRENLNYSGRRLLQVFPRRNGINTLEDANAIAQGGPEAIANAIYGGEWGRRPKNLGNTEPGDGWRFHGRGYVQLTGRDNYTRAGLGLGIDLVGNPELAAQRETAADIALHYWRSRVVAEGHQLDVTKATHGINGGENHLPERRAAFARWERMLTPEVMAGLERGEVVLPPVTGQISTSDPIVERIQQNLNHLGITDARGQPLVVDGNRGGPGSRTNEAIAAFRQRFGLDEQMTSAQLVIATQAVLDADPARKFDQAIRDALPPGPRPQEPTRIDGMPDYLLPGRTITRRAGTTATGNTPPQATPRPMPAITQLQPGDSGAAVRGLQQHLNLLGAADRHGQPLREDSDYGDRTKEAVEQFQLWTGREPTGIADRGTLDALQAQVQFAARQRAQGVAPGNHLADNLLPGQAFAEPAADLRPVEGQAQTGSFTPGEITTFRDIPRAPTPEPTAPLPFSSPDHPQHALYADAKTRLQAGGHDYPEDRLSQVTAQLHKMDIRPGWNGYVMEQAGQIWVRDVDPWGQHARIDLSVPAPPVHDSLRAVQQFELGEQQRIVQDRQQEMARGLQGPAP